MRLRTGSLIFAIVSMAGCGGNGDTCDGIDPSWYSVEAIHAAVLASEEEMDAPGYHAYSFAAELPALPEEPQAYNHLVLEVQAVKGFVHGLSAEQNFRLRWSLFQPAYACSAPYPYGEPDLASLTITSTGDFSPEYPAGTDLTKLFYVTYSSGPEPIAYEQDGMRMSYTAADFVDSNPSPPDLLLLRLGLPPELEQSHTFTVQYKTADGRVVSAETQSVQIAP